MRKNGYYWVEFLEFGAIDAVLFKDGTWRMEDPITDAALRVIGDALPLPTPEEIAGHPERLKRIVKQIWTENRRRSPMGWHLRGRRLLGQAQAWEDRTGPQLRRRLGSL